MHAVHCARCQLALVAPVNFCPRCGADQRPPAYPAMPAAAMAMVPGTRSDTLVYLILGWVFAALAMTSVSPLVLGPAALVMGAIAWSHGSRQGMAIVFVSIAAAVIGLLLSYNFLTLTEDVYATTEELITQLLV